MERTLSCNDLAFSEETAAPPPSEDAEAEAEGRTRLPKDLCTFTVNKRTHRK